MATQITERVREHRARMAAEGCQRLEVTIGGDVIGKMRKLAKQQQRPLWKVIEDACENYAHVSGNMGAT